jgi:hypothetical protein
MLMLRRYQFLSGFLANDHLTRVALMLPIFATDKRDNEMKAEAVHRYPGIEPYGNFLWDLGKPQLGGILMRVVQPVIASNGMPYLQMTS